MKQELEMYIKDIQLILNQIENLINNRNENLEICLWKTLDSTISILFIYIPKKTTQDHVVTILNAFTLLSSIIKVILSNFKLNDTIVETQFNLHQLVQFIKQDNLTDKPFVLLKLYFIMKSILFIYLNEKYTTPPLTPASSTFSTNSMDEDPTCYYQGGMLSTLSCNDTVNKRQLTKSSSIKNFFSKVKDIFDPQQQAETMSASDSGCFTNHQYPSLMHKKSLTSLQKEIAEPVFTLQKNPRTILKNVDMYQKEGSIFHLSENGKDVLILEVKQQKLLVVAGTIERLFLRLADETNQDLDYVDTFILSHFFFMDSIEFLENLMARFHLEPLPGEYEYFKKWSRCIQVKVLNVISRWIKLQFQDFLNEPILIHRLEAFLNGDVIRAGFTIESDMLKEAFNKEKQKSNLPRHTLIVLSIKRPSLTSLDSQEILTKDIAKYLTLADFYIFKCITAQEYLDSQHTTYIHIMTKRANKLTQWVLNEINLYPMNSKPRKATIRKMVEIAKSCLSWNNFHTCMVITMALAQLSEFRGGEWPSSMTTLKNLIDVNNNMSYYRTTFKKTAKAPCIPFFPIILKDLTFLMDGNATRRTDGLINYTKFRVLVSSVHTILYYTLQDYYFATDLSYYPFFPNSMPSSQLALDQVASIIEPQIKAISL